MSGTAADLPVKIGVDGLSEFEAAFNQLESRLNTAAGKQRQYEQATLVVQRAQESGTVSAERAAQVLTALQSRYEGSGRAAQQYAVANDNVARSSGQVAHQVQNASYQVGDFFVQVASGQSAITALAQQLPQLLGGFGMFGALAGAGVAIGAVVYRLMEGKSVLDQHEEVMKRVDAQYSSTTKAAEEWVNGLDKQAERLNILRARYQGLAKDAKEAEERMLSTRRAEIVEDGNRLASEGVDLSGLQSRLRLARSAAAGEIPNVSFGDLPAQVQAVTRALDAYRDSSEGAAQRSLELSNALASAQRMGGPLTSTLEPLVKGLDTLRPKLVENSDALKLVDQMLSALRNDSIPGAVGALADLMRQANAASTPFATLQQSVADTNARLQALRTGGLDALKTVTQQQTDALRIRKIEQDLAQAEAQRLEQTVRDEGERLRLFQEGAAARTKAATEAVQAERTLATETERAEAAKREAERRAREAAAAARRAGREAAAQERAEAEALARVWGDLRRDGQSGLLVGSQNDVTALRAIRDANKGTFFDPQERQRRQQESRRVLEEQQREAKQVTDDVVRYGADLFADMFISTEGGWNRMWQNMRRTAIGIAARIGAEAVIRPLVQPVVGSLLGSSALAGVSGGAGVVGSGSGLFGGLSQAFGFAGAGSSISKALGLGSISDALGLGGLGSSFGLSGVLNTPLFTTAAEMFGPLSAAAPTSSFFASATLGQLLGGAGAGFGLGTLLNSLVGGKSTGGMVGAGVGGLGGAGIGALIGGPAGALIGGLIGGSGGGLLGGLFGPGAPNPAASVQYGLDASGGLSVTGSKSKWMGDAEAIASVEATLSKLNVAIQSLGLTLSGVEGQVHFGKDQRTEEDERNMTLAVLEGLRGGSEAMTQVIRKEIARAQGGDADLDRALSAVEWARNMYDPIVNTKEATSALRQTVDGLTKSYDEVIKKAEEYGLATDVVRQRLAEAVEAARREVGSQYFQLMRSAEGRGYLNDIEGVRNFYKANVANFRDAGVDAEALYQQQLRNVLGNLTGEQLLDVANSFKGVDDAAANVASELLRLGKTADAAAKAQEREAAGREAAGVVASLADYARSLSYGDGSTLTARQQYELATSRFNDIAASAVGGDADSARRLQEFANEFLTTSRGVNGSGGAYAQDRERVLSILNQLGTASADSWTDSFLQGQQEQTETLSEKLDELVEVTRRMQQEAQQANARGRAA